MKIGFVSQALPYLPSRGGFRLYGANLIRRLARRHQIHLVSLLIDDDAEHLDWVQEHCASVRTIPVNRYGKVWSPLSALSAHLWGKPLQQRQQLGQILREHFHEWDVLHVEGGYAGGIIPPELPIAKVLSLHDSWTLRCEEMLRCAQSPGERLYYTLLKYHEPRYERLVYPRFDRCTAVADRDVEEIRRVVPRARVGLIPYGTDAEYFHTLPVEKEPKTLVFHSHLGYAPNIEAALEFANNILPLIRAGMPEVVCHLVGAEPGPKIRDLAARPWIRLSANLPDLRAAVCSGSVYVCAIRHGTGLKSKVLEAMAMRMPIVCYPGSTVGISAIPGRHLLVAQDPREFAEHVLDLLRDPERAEQLAQAGRELVEREYSWESRARAYEALYEQVIEERRESARVAIARVGVEARKETRS